MVGWFKYGIKHKVLYLINKPLFNNSLLKTILQISTLYCYINQKLQQVHSYIPFWPHHPLFSTVMSKHHIHTFPLVSLIQNWIELVLLYTFMAATEHDRVVSCLVVSCLLFFSLFSSVSISRCVLLNWGFGDKGPITFKAPTWHQELFFIRKLGGSCHLFLRERWKRQYWFWTCVQYHPFRNSSLLTKSIDQEINSK